MNTPEPIRVARGGAVRIHLSVAPTFPARPAIRRAASAGPSGRFDPLQSGGPVLFDPFHGDQV